MLKWVTERSGLKIYVNYNQISNGCWTHLYGRKQLRVTWGWSWISSCRTCSAGVIWGGTWDTWNEGINWWVWEEEKTQRWVWGSGREHCLCKVLGGFALCLHPGVMGDQLPAKSVEGKNHRCQNKLDCLLTEGPAWKKNNPSFSWSASAVGFNRRREAMEGKIEVLHHQDLISKYQPVYSLSWQESRSVSCAEEVGLEKRTREPCGKYFPKEWREEVQVNALLE